MLSRRGPVTAGVHFKVTLSYQGGVAGKKQQRGSEALGNHGFLAEFTHAPHHHQRFSADHVWLDPSGITQQGGGEIHQRILQLQRWEQPAEEEDGHENEQHSSGNTVEKSRWTSPTPTPTPTPRPRPSQSLRQLQALLAGASRTGCKPGSSPSQRLRWKRARFPPDSLSAGKETSVR